MTPGRVLLDGGARYYPVYFHSTPYFGLFGGEYVRIRRDGETGLQTTQEEERAASFISSSGRTQLFQESSDQIFNTLGATQATDTPDPIEEGAGTSACIELGPGEIRT